MAGKTTFEGFTPRRLARRRLVVVVAFDGVVLGDLATPCEIFGRATVGRGVAPYDVRVCSHRPTVTSAHVTLAVPWRLTLLRRADTIIVPGVDDVNRSVPDEVLRALRRARSRDPRGLHLFWSVRARQHRCAQWTRRDHALAGGRRAGASIPEGCRQS